MKILARTRPNLPLKANGNTRHFIHGRLPSEIVALQVARYADAMAGVYLLYLDELGEEITDTWHPDIGAALRQAADEFDVAAKDWVFAAGVTAGA